MKYETDIIVLIYLTLEAITSTHYSQIENGVQTNMLRLDVLLLEQISHLGLVRTWDGVCLKSIRCTR